MHLRCIYSVRHRVVGKSGTHKGSKKHLNCGRLYREMQIILQEDLLCSQLLTPMHGKCGFKLAVSDDIQFNLGSLAVTSTITKNLTKVDS